MYTAFKIIIGAVIALFIFLLLLPANHGGGSVVAVDNRYDSAIVENGVLKHQIEELKDVAFGLSVEKGHVEIELNKSKSELQQQIDKAKKAKKTEYKELTFDQLKLDYDTLSENSYAFMSDFDTLQDINYIIDSVVRVKDAQTDTLIARQDWFIKALTKDVVNTTVENLQLRNEKRAKKKKSALIAAGAFVAGLVAGLLTR
jgi:hypothetical protein